MNKPVERLNVMKPSEQPFDDDPTRSYTLPASWYFDSEIHDKEKYAIFYKSWHYAGHASQVEANGAFLTTRIHDQNIFVVRGEDGTLRGFHNVCMHRGHELVTGSGRKKMITCPYHAWTYRTDGTLAKARNTEGLPNFDPCDFTLRQVKVEVFLGLIFINCNLEAESFDVMHEGLREEILGYVPDAESLVFAKRQQYDVDCNWKTLIDNFLECYHCHVAHKDFVDLVNMDVYATEVHDWYSSHCSDGPVNADSGAYKISGDSKFSYAAWFIWPNTTIWIMPGEPNLSVLQMNPTAPEQTLEYLDWCLTDTTLSSEMQEASTYLDEVLQPEDIGLCESVQRGLKSIGYNQGRFVVDSERSELSEHGVHHFQALVHKAMKDGTGD